MHRASGHCARTFGWLALLLASWLLVPVTARAATRLGDGCDLSVLGAHDTSGFLHFDSSLRGR